MHQTEMIIRGYMNAAAAPNCLRVTAWHITIELDQY